MARDINDQGQVVGHGENAISPDTWRAFIWEDGVMTELSTAAFPGNTDMQAYGINNDGHVVGSANITGGQYHGP